MGETARRHSETLRRQGAGTAMDRLVFFSDAVYAIAITLLVIDISVRTVNRAGDELSTAVIGREMLAAWPSYVAFLISFAVIGANWVAHHRNMSQLKRWDLGLVWVNLALLLFIAFLPFPTRMLFEGDGRLSHPQVVIYALNVALIGLLQAALWALAWHRDLLDRDVVDEKIWRYELAQILVSPAVFLGSIVVEFAVGAPWSLYAWMLQIPLGVIVGTYEPRRRGRVSRSPDSAS